MNKNYLIQAHKSPLQLQKLINQLDDNESTFFVHIDLKSELSSFTKIINSKNVFFIDNRINCIWGDYSQVVATNLLIDKMLNTSVDGAVIFISGQDFPLKSNKNINSFLEKYDADFIEFDSFDLPVNNSDGELYRRLTDYNINKSDQRGNDILLPPISKAKFSQKIKYLKLLLSKKISFKDLKTFKKPRSAVFCNNKHYRGHNWWCMRYDTIKKIYEYYLSNKEDIDEYYKYTLCADEQFFHTIYKLVFPNSTAVSNFLHYIDWDREGVPLPVTFTSQDIELLLSQPENKLFARKFDIDFDSSILDLLQNELIEQSD